jgi:hypothetical protein
VRLVLKLRPGSGRLEGRVGREGGPCLTFSGTLELVARLEELEELEELEDTATPEEAQR